MECPTPTQRFRDSHSDLILNSRENMLRIAMSSTHCESFENAQLYRLLGHLMCCLSSRSAMIPMMCLRAIFSSRDFPVYLLFVVSLCSLFGASWFRGFCF